MGGFARGPRRVDDGARIAEPPRSAARSTRAVRVVGRPMAGERGGPGDRSGRKGFNIMVRQRVLGRLATTILALSPVVAGGPARGDADVPRAVVTLRGNVLCNRATDTRPWSWDPKDGDHTPVLYALEGTPEIAERLREIMDGYPDRGLDVDGA